jgi:hypothetical protein
MHYKNPAYFQRAIGSDIFEKTFGYLHSCNPTMDCDQSEMDVEQKDLYSKGGSNFLTHCVRSGAGSHEGCLIDFAEEVNNQQSQQNQGQAGE